MRTIKKYLALMLALLLCLNTTACGGSDNDEIPDSFE